MLDSLRHRITDLGLGLVEPVWASDGINSDETFGFNAGEAPVNTGALKVFDGSGRLLDRDITLEAYVAPRSGTSLPLSLYYDVSPLRDPETGMWLPSVLPEVVGKPSTDARLLAPKPGPPAAIRQFMLPSSDPEVKPGADLEFVFRLGNLYSVRALDPDDPRKFAPWVIPIRDIVKQRSGVTILNNVVNPDKGEKTILTYDLLTSGTVTVVVFTLDGDVVKYLHRGQQAAATYTYSWDGKNSAGRSVARGLYFIRVVGPGVDEIRKVMIVKD